MPPSTSTACAGAVAGAENWGDHPFCCQQHRRWSQGSGTAAQALGDYGRHLGLAFQITDDLLDAVSDAETLGKPVGADALAGKATFVTLLGVEAARARAAQEISAARSALSSLDGHINDDGAALAFLSSLAEYVLTRHH